MSNRKAASVIASLLLVVGVVFIVLDVSVTDSRGVDITCGNALHADTSFSDLMTSVSFGAADYTAECQNKIATRRAFSFPLAGVGAVALLFLGLTTDWKTASTRWDAEEQAARAAEHGTGGA